MVSVAVAAGVWLLSFAFGCSLAFCWMAPKAKRERGMKEFFCYWMNQNAKVIRQKQGELGAAERTIIALRRTTPGRDNTGRFVARPKNSAVMGSE